MSTPAVNNPSVAGLLPLWRLARRCGVQPAYIDNQQRKQRAQPESLLAILKTLGIPINHIGEADDLHRAVDAQHWRRPIEPVIVYWVEPIGTAPVRKQPHMARAPLPHGRGSACASMLVRLTAAQDKQRLALQVECESEPRPSGSGASVERSAPSRSRLGPGELHQSLHLPSELPLHERRQVDGQMFSVRRLDLPAHLPAGYHRLTLDIGRSRYEATIIAAPMRARPIGSADSHVGRSWGVFAPLYAVRSGRDWGAGDLTDLRHLLEWTNRHGGCVVGTLPLLAQQLPRETPAPSPTQLGSFDPSPYSPVSRLFFNEFYLDVNEAVASLNGIRGGAVGRRPSAIVESRNTIAALREGSHVDYPQLMALKRRVLQPLASAAFAAESAHGEIERRVAADPLLGEYARFRAVSEARRGSWRDWPASLHGRVREGGLREEDADHDAVAFHLFVQCELRRQLAEVASAVRGGRESGTGLYLDLPVGVHGDGFDCWRFREHFADGASCGAPPDDFFTGGQNWGFAPLHPWRSRESGHAYFAEAIRRHLRVAGMLRIDHVMWLHRMFWIPDGASHSAGAGTYVRNPEPEELYAILCLESHRHDAAIAGENLGTVPRRVNRAMQRHGIAPLFVGQFSFASGEFTAENLFQPVPRGAVASLNTHDTPTFAGFWRGRDIDQRLAQGLMTEEEASAARAGRADLRRRVLNALDRRRVKAHESDPRTVLAALLEELGRSDAAIVLVTLEDLWAEERPQNTPGTPSWENWSRKHSVTLEELDDAPLLTDALHRLRVARRG